MATKFEVKGRVLYDDEPSKPVGGAMVEASQQGELKGQDTTPADGKFTLKLEPGKYDLKAVSGTTQALTNIEVKNKALELDLSFKSPQREPDEFDNLRAMIVDKEIEAPVSIDEARQLRRLYTVGNYLLAKVPQSIRVLKDDLGGNGPITSILYDDVLQEQRDLMNGVIENVAAKNKNDDLSVERVFSDLREQCDLGTSAVDGINVEFKTIFKEFVTLCADEMLAVPPDDVDENKLYWDAKKKEERNKFLKKLIGVIIKLTRNMSVAGGMGTKERVNGWAGIISDSINVLFEAGKKVHTHNQDERHGFSLLARLNGVPKSELKPYLVHAKEGGYMLQYTVDIYSQLEKDRREGKKVEDDLDYISTLLYNKEFFSLDDKTASMALKSIATTVLDNWLPDWQ